MPSSLVSCPVTSGGSLTDIICQITLLVLQVVPILVSLALLFFFWGIAQWILSMNSGNEDDVKKGRERTVWGLVALFFILSIGGVISILMNTFFTGAGGTTTGTVPRSSISQPFVSGGGGAINANVQVTGGAQTRAQNPGFFRSIWNRLGF